MEKSLTTGMPPVRFHLSFDIIDMDVINVIECYLKERKNCQEKSLNQLLSRAISRYVDDLKPSDQFHSFLSMHKEMI